MNTIFKEVIKGKLFFNGEFLEREYSFLVPGDDPNNYCMDDFYKVNNYDTDKLAVYGDVDGMLSFEIHEGNPQGTTPMYMIEFWNCTSLQEYFFANDLINLNDLLGRFKPLIDLMEHEKNKR